MLDTLKLYELRNKIYHLNTNIDDDLFLNIFNNKNFNTLEKLDVIYATIYQTIKPMAPELQDMSNEEIFNRCHTIIKQAVNLSIYDYTEEEIERISILFWLSTVNPPTSIEEIQKTINKIEPLILDNEDLDETEQFINEELRLFLLSFYQTESSLYGFYEDRILFHLEKAQKMVQFRLLKNSLLAQVE